MLKTHNDTVDEVIKVANKLAEMVACLKNVEHEPCKLCADSGVLYVATGDHVGYYRTCHCMAGKTRKHTLPCYLYDCPTCTAGKPVATKDPFLELWKKYKTYYYHAIQYGEYRKETDPCHPIIAIGKVFEEKYGC